MYVNPFDIAKTQEAVDRMWREVKEGGVHRANSNDTIHFLHEEACEVAKAAMELGLIGSHEYKRSEAVELREYSLADLIEEVGDVLLMALTLASTFDVDAGVCLEVSVEKFYLRAGQEYLDRFLEGREAGP